MVKLKEQSKEVCLDNLPVFRAIGRTVTSMSYGFIYLDTRNVKRIQVRRSPRFPLHHHVLLHAADGCLGSGKSTCMSNCF